MAEGHRIALGRCLDRQIAPLNGLPSADGAHPGIPRIPPLIGPGGGTLSIEIRTDCTVLISGPGRGRPKRIVRDIRKSSGINCRIMVLIIYESMELSCIGQPPVIVSGSIQVLTVLQGVFPAHAHL